MDNLKLAEQVAGRFFADNPDLVADAEPFGTDGHDLLIPPRLAGHPIAEQRVIRCATDRAFDRCQGIPTAARVRKGASRQIDKQGARLPAKSEKVDTGPAIHDVDATTTTDQDIVANASIERIIPETAVEDIAALLAKQVIIAAHAGQGIAAKTLIEGTITV